MTRKKTLVFHIGDHKTGSTSIQQAFALNKVTLTGRTLFYPGRQAHNHLGAAFRAQAKPKPKAAHEKALKSITNIANRLRKSDADVCLISAESFEQVKPQAFHDILTRHFADICDDIRVVAYVRPHSARILSSFAERIKIGSSQALNGTPETFFTESQKAERFHYGPRFSAWRDLFGESFILRPMIGDQLHQGSVVSDFVRYGLGQEDFQLAPLERSNQSLCLEDLMRLKLLHSCFTDHPHKLTHSLGWEMSRLLDSLPPLQVRTKLRLDKGLARDVHAAYLADARAMDREFFGQTPLLETELTKAIDTAGETAQSLDPSDWLDPGEVRSLSLMAQLVAGMTEKNPGKWAAFWRAKYLDELHQGGS